MPDAIGLVKAMKKSAVEAVDATKPVRVCFGEVASASPLKINVEQRMTLGRAQLVLSRNVTDYKAMAATQWSAEDSEKKEVAIYNGLAVGDKVILLRQQDGQKYIVWDRIGL